MSRIFLSLSILSLLVLAASVALGFLGDDPASSYSAWHFLVSVAGMVFGALVHAIVLTYFMGTGRWIEETAAAYRLDDRRRAENRRLKYRTVPLMLLAFCLLLAAGVTGAAADPGATVNYERFASLSAGTIHLLVSLVMLAANAAVMAWEYRVIRRNGALIAEVVTEVRRIREGKGLPV
ncbi:MAG: hypothetical protein ACREIV_07450, partial [Planctomycetaceae bacterium]